MSKKSRRRQRDVVSNRNRISYDYDTYRSPLARIARAYEPRRVLDAYGDIDVKRNRRLPAVRPRSKVGRLRSPLSISPKSLAQMPHDNRRQALKCVKEHLSEMREVQGSGGGRRRKSRGRQEQRRQIFQAARKSC